jgi:hypothetical protein
MPAAAMAAPLAPVLKKSRQLMLGFVDTDSSLTVCNIDKSSVAQGGSSEVDIQRLCMYGSNSRAYVSCPQRNLQPPQLEASSGSIAVRKDVSMLVFAAPACNKIEEEPN